MTLIRVLGAEWLKMRNTLAFWLALIIPIAMTVLQFFMFLDRGPVYADPDQSIWTYLVMQTMNFWTLLMVPLFVTLQTALVAGLEHNNQMWKKLFALPVPRWMVYGAKQISSTAIIMLSWIILIASTVFSGLLLHQLRPEYGLEAIIPWSEFLPIVGLSLLSCWLLIALHTFISLRWPSFVVSSAFGIVMTVLGVAVINSKYGPYYPWIISALVINQHRSGLDYLTPLLVGTLGGLAMTVIGGWFFLRRDVT